MSDADRATGIGLGSERRVPGSNEAEAVFEAMQARLDELQNSPLVRNDAVARGLLEGMARAVGMDDVVALLDQLDARVRLLLQRRQTPTTARRERPSRTMIRL